MDTIEATNTLANLKRYISGGGVVDRKASEAIDMAIRALEVITDPDTISRQQAEMIQELYYSNKLVCSNCGIEARWDYEFCPYCGFKFKQTGGAV